MKTRIIWNGTGGELDSVTIDVDDADTSTVREALIAMIDDAIVAPGDSFVIEEVN